MAEESEMEGIVSSAHNTGSETGALVEVKFEKNPYQTQKYLEAEPKALGVTQIMLALFYLSVLYLNWEFHYSQTPVIISASLSPASIIAGSVAIAAQNLRLPTLRACLGMQIVACVFSVLCFFISSTHMVEHSFRHYCWDHGENSTSKNKMCERLWSITEHITGIQMLVQATQIALSATLAAFCCKVIQCCSPKSNVFGDDPFLFQHDYTPVHKASSHENVVMHIVSSSTVSIKSLHFIIYYQITMFDRMNLLFIPQSIIAGSVAIAAQNLHLPRLKACLGLQVVVCVTSLLIFLENVIDIWNFEIDICWDNHLNATLGRDLCDTALSIARHVTEMQMLVQATQIALSATLSAFCCKVIQCCSPKRNV
ncbi:hypothetical protein QTP86_019866, partial [Hemibagrus guttatus]